MMIELIVAGSLMADAQWKHRARLDAPKEMLPLGLGAAVAASETGWIAVGCGRDSDIGTDAGAVAIWRSESEGIRFEEVVAHPSNRRDCAFGAALALDQLASVLVIGAPNEDGRGEWPDDFQMGRVYLCEWRERWKVRATIESPHPGIGAHFGAVVATDGTRIVVGSPDHSGAGFASGRADVFIRHGDSWVCEGALLAPDDGSGSISGRRFGTSLAISKDTIIVGSPQSSGVGYSSGRADIFRLCKDGWQHSARVDAPSPQSSAMFGMSVAIWSDRRTLREAIAIGAPGETPTQSQSFPKHAGVVHLYDSHGAGTELERWTLSTTLTSPQPWCGSAQFRPEAFGMSMALRLGVIAIGASESCNPAVAGEGHEEGEGSGAVYVFRSTDLSADTGNSPWTFDARITAPDAALEVHDGYRIALGFGHRPLLIVGRLGNPDLSPGPGRANVYERP